MKAFARLQRGRSQHAGPGISLFPFLAVLICTMGALVPLLLAITRIARQQAEAAAVAKLSDQTGEIKTQREDARWRIEQLKKSRIQTESQLADARLDLGHLEDHSRRLRDKLAQYERTVEDLEKLENVDQTRLAQSQTELQNVQRQIGATQQELAKASQSGEKRHGSFAVVPYEGPNQTHRRPIYLECREDAVVLQPEGIVFSQNDFEGPLGPSNPLAASLRAAREYMLAQRDFDPQAGEPYPMLLVRPEGIGAYYAARAAMKSWAFEFGYELIDDGWKLAYPPQDARLADVVRQTIASARLEQAKIIASAPRHYGVQPKASYRAAPTRGGFVRDDGGSADDDGRNYAPAGVAGRVAGQGSGVGHHGSGSGEQDSGVRGHGTGNGGPETGGDGRATGGGGSEYNPYAAVGTGGSGNGTGGDGRATGGVGHGTGTGGQETSGGGTELNPYASSAVSDNGNGTGGVGGTGNGVGNGLANGPTLTGNGATPTGTTNNATGKYVAGNAMPSCASGPTGGTTSATGGTGTFPRKSYGQPAYGQSATGHSATGGAVERPEGYVMGQPPREQPAENNGNKPCGDGPLAPARIPRPGEWEPRPEMPPERRDKDSEKDEKDKRKHPPEKLAEKRGADWGLRDAARGSVGVTRPIVVECHPDRLVVISDRGPTHNKVVAVGPRIESSIDTFISAVWEHMEAWGIAGRSMYWRPVLNVYVAPGAEQNYSDLASLLDGSGLTVVRKK